MSLPYKENLISYAKNLRKNATKQEKHLWYDFLCTYSLRFQRQKVIGNYIVDFYCHKAKLAIELDGSQHYENDALKYDNDRTEFLKSQGIYVLRILNLDIDKNFEAVCVMIDQTAKRRCNYDH